MSHLQRKSKRVIQVVDATASINASDETHIGVTPLKRKQQATRREELEQLDKEEGGAEHIAKRKALIEKALDTNIKDYRQEVMQVAKAKMTKKEQHIVESERLKAIGAKLKKAPVVPRTIQQAVNRNVLEKSVKYYEQQKELGMAEGLVNPMVAHRQKMKEKYGENNGSLKLHSVGHVEKDGTTLTIGKGAQKRTAKKIQTLRRGGNSTKSIFKNKKK